METTTSKLPRGIRNNNPLNIRKTVTKWRGLSLEQADPDFFQFIAMEWGIRAACKIIQTYVNKYHLSSVREIIYRWAPPSDGNDTEAYVRSVCRTSVFPPDMCIDATDRDKLFQLLYRMIKVECGYALPAEIVHRGITLAFSLRD